MTISTQSFKVIRVFWTSCDN